MARRRYLGFKVEGAKELIKDMNKVSLMQQSTVTRAAKAGARVAMNAVKSYAPYQTGTLASALMLKPEKSRVVKAGKKVYQVTFDPAMNEQLVKITKDGKRYYYPASMEYGFRTKNGGYIPGFHYMRNALIENKDLIEQTVIGKMWYEIVKALRKRGQ